MAKGKRTLDRRTLRDQSDAAEPKDGEEEVVEVTEEPAPDDDGDDDDAKPKAKKAKAKAKPKVAKAPAVKRVRTPKEVRTRAIWVLFDNGNKRLGTFPYPQKAEAEAALAKQQEEKKGTYYIQMVKEAID